MAHLRASALGRCTRRRARAPPSCDRRCISATASSGVRAPVIGPPSTSASTSSCAAPDRRRYSSSSRLVARSVAIGAAQPIVDVAPSRRPGARGRARGRGARSPCAPCARPAPSSSAFDGVADRARQHAAPATERCSVRVTARARQSAHAPRVEPQRRLVAPHAAEAAQHLVAGDGVADAPAQPGEQDGGGALVAEAAQRARNVAAHLEVERRIGRARAREAIRRPRAEDVARVDEHLRGRAARAPAAARDRREAPSASRGDRSSGSRPASLTTTRDSARQICDTRRIAGERAARAARRSTSVVCLPMRTSPTSPAAAHRRPRVGRQPPQRRPARRRDRRAPG